MGEGIQEAADQCFVFTLMFFFSLSLFPFLSLKINFKIFFFKVKSSKMDGSFCPLYFSSITLVIELYGWKSISHLMP